MTDELTHLQGARIRCVRGVHYVVVTISEMFPGPPPTILGLAQTFRLPSERVFDLLLSLRPNTPALRGLHRDQIGGELPAGPEGLSIARRELLQRARRYTISNHGRSVVLSENPFETWTVSPIGDAPIVLPVSEGFLEVLDEPEEAASREAEKITRELRVSATKPLFHRLNELLGQLKGLILELESHVKILAGFQRDAVADVAFLDALGNMFGWMGTHPKGVPPSANDREEVETLKLKFDRLYEVAMLDMVLEPVSEAENEIFRDRERVAGEVLAMCEPDSEFVVLLKVYRESLNIAPDRFHSEIPQLLESAYTNLLHTRRAEDVVERHVLPLIDLFASRALSAAHVQGSVDLAFGSALKISPAPGGVQNALTVIGGLAAIAPIAVGNLPGPASLCVAVVGLANTVIATLVLRDPERAVQIAARLTRMLVTIGYMTPGRATVMIRNMSAGKFAEIVELDWTKNFQRGPKLASFLSIAFMISLYLAITNDDPSTLRRWANIISNASGATLSVAVALQHLAILSDSKTLGVLAKGNVGKALGVIGAVASIVSGSVTAVQEYGEKDTSGVILASSVAVGGAVTVAGFLFSAGLIAEGSVAGIPVGLVLQGVGLAIGLTAGTVALIRDATTEGTQLVFKTLLLLFGRSDGAFALMNPQSKRLRSAFDDVLASHHSVNFWAISSDAIPALAQAKFPVKFIAVMVDEDESTIEKLMIQQGVLPR